MTTVRVVVAALLPLTIDEPYYALWSHHLALGYYDHPPLMAWLCAPFIPLGPSPFAVRLAALACTTICPILVYAYARRLCRNELAAAAGGVAALIAPYYSVIGIMVSPEFALQMTWAWVLLAAQIAIFPQPASPPDHNEEASPPVPDPRINLLRWGNLGLALGLALLSKFTSFALPFGLALFFAISPRARKRWLGTPWPYLAGVVALAVYSPFLWWSSQHRWETFVFQATARSNSGFSFQLGHIPGFVAGTLAGLSPILGIAFVPALLLSLRQAFGTLPTISGSTGADVADHREGIRLALCIGLPPLTAICLAVPISHVQVYWTLCTYLSLFPLLGLWYAQSRRSSYAWPAVILAFLPLAIATSAVVVPSVMFRLAGRPQGTGLTEMYGMSSLERKIESVRSHMPRPSQTFFAAEDHRLASQLSLMSGESALMFTTDARGLEYLRWEDPKVLAGDDCVLVMRRAFVPERTALRKRLRVCFDRVGKSHAFLCTWHGRPAQTFYLARCYGFHPDRAGRLTMPPP